MKTKHPAYYKAGDVETAITQMIVRMHDVMQLAGEPVDVIIESWRDELTCVRSLVQEMSTGLANED